MMKTKKIIVFVAGFVVLVSSFCVLNLKSFAGDSVDDLKKEIEALRAEVEVLKSSKQEAEPVIRPHGADIGNPWAAQAWNPFAEMQQMQNRMNRLFSDSFMRSGLFGGPAQDEDWAPFYEPDLEMREHDNHYEFSLDLPGLEKDRIDLKVTEHAIMISGERRFEQKEEDDKRGFYRMERSYGTFHRSIPLPDDANIEGVKADYKDGVLKIEIKKKESQKNGKEARKITIT